MRFPLPPPLDPVNCTNHSINRQRVRPTYDAEVDYLFLGPAVSTTNDSLDDEKNGTAFLSNSGLHAPARRLHWQTARLGLLG